MQWRMGLGFQAFCLFLELVFEISVSWLAYLIIKSASVKGSDFPNSFLGKPVSWYPHLWDHTCI